MQCWLVYKPRKRQRLWVRAHGARPHRTRALQNELSKAPWQRGLGGREASHPAAPVPALGACEMAGGPEAQGGAGLMRHSKSRCQSAGSDRSTRFPFRIRRVFPFFPAWPTEGFLNWTWRSSIISVARLAKGNSGKLPASPEEAPGSRSRPRPRAAQAPRELSLLPRAGRAHSSLRAPPGPAPVGAALKFPAFAGRRKRGVPGLSTHSGLLGLLLTARLGPPSPYTPPAASLLVSLTLSQSELSDWFLLQSAFATRANCSRSCHVR